MSDLNEKAQQYLGLLEVKGGADKPWAFAKAIDQSMLDGSVESLGRIEQLLLQIHERFHPTPAILERPDVKAFAHLLTFYIGNHIARRCQVAVEWHSYESAVQISPPGSLPREPWSEVFGQIGSSPCVPLGLILDWLSKGKAAAMGVGAYVDRLVERYSPEAPLPEHERCHVLLAAVARGQEPKGGMLFMEQLASIPLDYSMNSLKQLDRLLLSIRQNDPPDFQRVMGVSAYVNFLRWCSYYLGASIARQAGVFMKWMTLEEARQMAPNLNNPDLDSGFAYHHACLLGAQFFFPLVPACTVLFGPLLQRLPLAAYAEGVIAKMPSPLRPMQLLAKPRSKEALAAAGALPLACFEAGSFAAFSLSMESIEGQDTSLRLLQGARADQKSVVVDFSMFDSAEQAHQMLDTAMNHNPENRPFLAFAQDSYANLVTGRKDALTIHLKVFTPARLMQRSSTTEFVFLLPYRKPGAQAYATFTPLLQHTDLTDEPLIQACVDAFMSGLVSFKTAEFAWQRFFDPVDLLA